MYHGKSTYTNGYAQCCDDLLGWINDPSYGSMHAIFQAALLARDPETGRKCLVSAIERAKTVALDVNHGEPV